MVLLVVMKGELRRLVSMLTSMVVTAVMVGPPCRLYLVVVPRRITLLLLLLLWLNLMKIGHEVPCGAMITGLLIIARVTALVFSNSNLTIVFIGALILSKFVTSEGAILGICFLRLQLFSIIKLIIWHMS